MPKVIILGGGVAGLSAAHELIYRNFEVEVYEKNPNYVGGKARSIDYTNEGKYTRPLPGEHGFRFFPGFYQHITATMREIPFQKNDRTVSVFDNLVATQRIMIARYGKPPIITPSSFPRTRADIELLIKDITGGVNSGLSKEELKFFAERVWQLVTSCSDRRNNDYERISWWKFTEAEKFSESYRHLLVEGLTRTLVAAKAELASTKTGGDIFLQLLYCNTDPSIDTDRVLNGPTNEKWLNPWKEHLINKGVVIHQGVSATSVEYNQATGSISGITIQENNSSRQVTGDYYLLAVPVEKAAELINDSIIEVDNSLLTLKEMATSVAWMNGIQYFLNQDVPVNKGHVICSDSEWAITCISQTQFWEDYSISQMGNGEVKGVLSVDISDWQSPGKFTTNKTAEDCTRDEVEKEVWEQLKHSLNTEGIVISDEMKVDYYLDRDIQLIPSSQVSEHVLKNIEPLLVNRINSWDLRPNASTGIPNLFFASDYVRTHTDLATMEGANEAARRAVNGIIDATQSNLVKCPIQTLHEPFCFAPLKWYDQYRYNQGLNWTLHSPLWLKIITILLGFIYIFSGFVKSAYRKIGLQDESAFIVNSIFLTLGFAMLDAWLDWGTTSAFMLTFIMYGSICLHSFSKADSFMQRIIVLGTAAGFTELLANNWLIKGLHALNFPDHQPSFFSTPAYMPFAWALILVQIGYVGYIYSFKKSTTKAFILNFSLGILLIAVFNIVAKNAHWWEYAKSEHMLLQTPTFILLGNGLICAVLPFIFRQQLNSSTRISFLIGIGLGLWIFAAYLLSHILLG
ncbi:MAG: FAD-dependent oxidoreductase [Chitinophagia bacterium]